MNGTGPGSDCAAKLKQAATINGRLKTDTAECQGTIDPVVSSGGAGSPLAVAPTIASTLTPARFVDPWGVVIAGLKDSAKESYQPPSDSGRECASLARRATVAGGALVPAAFVEGAVVTFVERLGPKSVSITWRAPALANYCEQRWIRRIARSHGVCALSGNRIVRGDAVYGPADRTAARPVNAAQMVRAEAIENLESSV